MPFKIRRFAGMMILNGGAGGDRFRPMAAKPPLAAEGD